MFQNNPAYLDFFEAEVDWCFLLCAFFDLPDFIAEEEFVVDTVVFSVWFFATDWTFAALPEIVIVSANASIKRIVFIVLKFYVFNYDSNVGCVKPNGS